MDTDFLGSVPEIVTTVMSVGGFYVAIMNRLNTMKRERDSIEQKRQEEEAKKMLMFERIANDVSEIKTEQRIQRTDIDKIAERQNEMDKEMVRVTVRLDGIIRNQVQVRKDLLEKEG